MPKKQPDFSAPAANLDSGIALQTEGFYRARYRNPREMRSNERAAAQPSGQLACCAAA
jgi:hypothetical protein